MQQSSDEFEGLLANYPFVDTEDAVTARERISTLLIPHQLEVHRGLLPFRAVHRHVALDKISLHYLRYETEVTMRWLAPRWFHLLVVPVSGLCRVGIDRRRFEIGPGECFIFDPAISPRFDMIGNCQAIFVKISSAELSVRSPFAHDKTVGSVIEFDSKRAVQDETCGSLIELVHWVCRDVDHISSVSMNPIAGRRVEDLIIDTVLSACPRDGAVPKPPANSKAVPQNVRRCEEFIGLHAATPVAITDMTEVSGASERMLFQAFRDYRQTSPMAYLKARRLDGAHADLAGAREGGRTVSQIASGWGFTNPGHFSREYRRKFGRIPSDTLRGEPHPGYPDIPDASGDV